VASLQRDDFHYSRLTFRDTFHLAGSQVVSAAQLGSRIYAAITLLSE
jgi:hypothetical protein